MRFKSPKTDGLQAFAVTGVNTVAFAITASDEAKEGLARLRRRARREGKEAQFRPGFKVFRSVVPKPDKDTRVSTERHPVQSFVWDDFTAEPGDANTCTASIRCAARRRSLDRTADPIDDPRPDRSAVQRPRARHLLQPRRRQQPGLREEVRQQEADALKRRRRRRGARVAEPELDDAILKFIDCAEEGRHAARAASTSSATSRCSRP